MICTGALEYEKKYMPYAVFDEKGDIIGFKPGTPKTALIAAKDHILMSRHFDDVSNAGHWNNLLKKLGLDNI